MMGGVHYSKREEAGKQTDTDKDKEKDEEGCESYEETDYKDEKIDCVI